MAEGSPNKLLSRRDPLKTKKKHKLLKGRKFFVFKFYFLNIQQKSKFHYYYIASKQANKTNETNTTFYCKTEHDAKMETD